MNKELQSFPRIEKSSKRYKGRKDDLDAVFTAIRNCETERSLRIRLENANYELVREKEENQKKLKAFEIIKEKNVNVAALMFWNTTYKYKGKLSYQIYLDILEDCDLGEKLTQEEFDLLMKELC